MFVFTNRQAVTHGHALVEHKTLAFPQAFLRWNLLQIFKNAALQVIDIFEALFEHKRRGLFATNPTGAKHRYFFMFFGIQVFAHIRRKVAESSRLRIDRPAKSPDVAFVIVTRIDD